MSTYYLISTTNAQTEGWKIYGEGSKNSCKYQLDINPNFIDKTQLHNDIVAQTLLKNAKVVSKTEAINKYKMNSLKKNTIDYSSFNDDF